MKMRRTLAERLADARAKARKAQHQAAIADRKAVSKLNRDIRRKGN